MSDVHLLVLTHGMWGNPGHLAELHRIMDETKAQVAKNDGSDTQLEILLAKTNSEESTYDGMDWGGERVAEEIYEAIERIEKDGRKVTRFSITGYSLGGLVARYVIGILHQRKFFENIEPVNFNTIATPHIGVPRYPSFFSGMAQYIGPRLLSRTGEQFFLADKWSLHGRPLLEVMADPQRIFYQALELFPHKRIYANAVNDGTVPYVTAAIEADDPFYYHETNGLKVELDDKYSPIMKSWTLPAVPPPKPPSPTPLSAEWFENLRNARPLLPPFLQFKFPFNLLMYMALPVLLPTFMSLAILRLTRESRRSTKRIKLLESSSTDSDSTGQRLMHVLLEMEKQMEDAVAEMIDEDPGRTLSSTPTLSGASTPQHPTDSSAPIPIPNQSEEVIATKQMPVPKCQSKKAKARKEPKKPVLTPLQLQLIENLNRMPGLLKERAFIDPVRHSHAIIVCRDVKRFEGHRMGEGVLRHWADRFIL